jgi:hypothetical protein
MSINAIAAGRTFWDAIPDGDDFRLRFTDGVEIVCAWGSQGPEVKATHFGVITKDRSIHPQFQYVSGKLVRQVLTDGKKLIIQFSDGHELRSDFKRGPKVEAVDVRMKLTEPSFEQFAASALGVDMKFNGTRWS